MEEKYFDANILVENDVAKKRKEKAGKLLKNQLFTQRVYHI